MRRLKTLSIVATLALLTQCAPPPPRPAPAPAPPPPAPPKPAAAPANSDWRDAPLTPGNWSYQPRNGGTDASFGTTGAQPATGPTLAISCTLSTRSIGVSIKGAGTTSLLIRTTFGDARIAVESAGSIENPRLAGRWGAYDPFLDRLAYSLGRFAIETGRERLILPVQPEIARVIEDCRG